ncbi:hypothetical protein ECDEC9B_2505 [Escherichia coli DEC9B]|nr:hypothetical protein ECDEC9B_2505 [Escherichia coli DEC9B]
MALTLPESGRNAAFFIIPFQIINIKNGYNRLKTVGTVFTHIR